MFLSSYCLSWKFRACWSTERWQCFKARMVNLMMTGTNSCCLQGFLPKALCPATPLMFHCTGPAAVLLSRHHVRYWLHLQDGCSCGHQKALANNDAPRQVSQNGRKKICAFAGVSEDVISQRPCCMSMLCLLQGATGQAEPSGDSSEAAAETGEDAGASQNAASGHLEARLSCLYSLLGFPDSTHVDPCWEVVHRHDFQGT